MTDTETERLVAWLFAIFEAKTGVDVRRTDETAVLRVRDAAARACAEWAAAPSDSGVEINLPFLTSTDAGAQHLEEHLAPGKLRRILAGDPLADEIEAARQAREAAAESAKRARRVMQADSTAETRKVFLIGALIVVALFASAAATVVLKESRSHSHADRHHEGEHAR